MAGTGGLSRAARRRLLVLAAAVLAGHVLVLHLFSQWQPQARLLRPMTAPLYTRVLQPAAPPPVQAVAPAPPAAPAGRLQAARPVQAAPAARAPAPRAAASEPAAQPATVAQDVPPPPPPVEVAAAPAAAASEPAPAASEVAPAAPPVPAAAAEPPTAVPPAPTTAPAAAPTVADTWPPDTRLRYRLGGRFRSGELYGSARVLWQREGERYQVRVEVDVTLLASLVMTSQGEVRPGGLLPQVYQELRRGGARGVRMGEREIALANGAVVRRPPGVQDTASQFVELTHRFATGQAALQVGQSVSFWMARPGQIDLWTYDVVRSEVLRTRLGDIEAFHLKPRPIANPRGNITAEMWFAPSLQYLPVRIQVHMGEEAMIDLLVEAIEQR